MGTLTGDALIHLLPHALLPVHGGGAGHGEADHDDHLHQRAVWLGLVAAAALMGFYFFEKLINILQNWRSRRRLQVEKMSNEKGEVRPRVLREGHEVSEQVRGESKCIQKYSSYCVADLQPGVIRKTVGESSFKPVNRG